MLIMQIKDFLIYLFEHTVYIFSGTSIKEYAGHCIVSKWRPVSVSLFIIKPVALAVQILLSAV